MFLIYWLMQDIECDHRTMENMIRKNLLINQSNTTSEICLAPTEWTQSCSNTESKLHQLSPYIGKLKSTIATDLINKYSCEGDTILDPFSGSGTIPLCAAVLSRNAIAADVSQYSAILTKAKLFPPINVDAALKKLKTYEKLTRDIQPSLEGIPPWVTSFFNPDTLEDILKWTTVLRESGNEFYLACLLGVLHHQRPGFLSYPSSHLVPYLRDNKYPKDLYPSLYEYREVYPRLLKKVKRVFTSTIPAMAGRKKFFNVPIQKLEVTEKISCIITSPPYMNALDYLRDNRLRLWFIDSSFDIDKIKEPTNSQEAFLSCMESLFVLANNNLKINGHCVLIIGDLGRRILGKMTMPELITFLANQYGPNLKQISTMVDIVPDVRRSRRNCRGVKNEYIMVFERTH